MSLTNKEKERLAAVKHKLSSVSELLNNAELTDTSSLSDWLKCLNELKNIVGNAHNDLGVVACLMAKDYLSRKLPMRPYDAVAKAQGAPGLDIDEETIHGQRVIGEIKTTGAYGHKDIRGPQVNAIRKDLQRLQATPSEFKFFFVADADIYSIVRRKYSAFLSDVTLVLLSACEKTQ